MKPKTFAAEAFMERYPLWRADPSRERRPTVSEMFAEVFGPGSVAVDPEYEANLRAGHAYWKAVFTPKPEPTDFPRSDWSATTFGIPFYVNNCNLGDQANWGCKNASIAVLKAMETGDWTGIGQVGVTLMICDKVLQLNLHARHTRSCTASEIEYDDWKQERERDIKRVHDWAMNNLPASATKDVTLSRVSSISFDALHANWEFPFDAKCFPTAEQATAFDRLVLGEYAPQPSTAAAAGYTIYQGSVDVSDPGIDNRLATDALRWNARHQDARVGRAPKNRRSRKFQPYNLDGLKRVHLPDVPPGTTWDPPKEKLSACGRFVLDPSRPR